MAKRRKHSRKNPSRRRRNAARRRHRRSNPSMRLLGMKPMTLGLLALGGWLLWRSMKKAKAGVPQLTAPTAPITPSAVGDGYSTVAGGFSSVAGGYSTVAGGGGIFESQGGLGSLS